MTGFTAVNGASSRQAASLPVACKSKNGENSHDLDDMD